MKLHFPRLRTEEFWPFLMIGEAAILILLATFIYLLFSVASQWQTDFRPLTRIDLSVGALPYYTMMSAARGIVAYAISLSFTLVVGYVAAKFRFAERILIPILDVLQSVPVLGFLPGLIIGLVGLFPRTNTGLELAAIIMIFTGQVWNMTFAYYSSIKSIPNDLREASRIIGLGPWDILRRIELPFAAVHLAWNSVLSMAGGWFFLIACEAFTLGNQEYRLPGIGAYMDVAIKSGDKMAMFSAVVAMILLIMALDFAFWRPVLSWVQRYRLEISESDEFATSLMQIWLKKSKLVRYLAAFYREFVGQVLLPLVIGIARMVGWGLRRMEQSAIFRARSLRGLSQKIQFQFRRQTARPLWRRISAHLFSIILLERLLLILGAVLLIYGAWGLTRVLASVSLKVWFILLRNTLWTLLRVVGSIMLSTFWAVPAGIWIGVSPQRTRMAQPFIQILAAFPTPMLYPLMIGLLEALHVDFSVGSMFLMVMGVQWYVLFAVLAGALRIPPDLTDALSLMAVSRLDRWRRLYLPSIFPPLVTGWITAAGGAWNASVVAEYLIYHGQVLKTGGLGASLFTATENGNIPLFAASLSLMVVVVVVLNRAFWNRLYHLTQTRYRMEA